MATVTQKYPEAARRLTEWIKGKGWDGRDLAGWAGVTYSTAQTWLRGIGRPGSRELRKKLVRAGAVGPSDWVR